MKLYVAGADDQPGRLGCGVRRGGCRVRPHGYALTREVAELVSEEWTPPLLDERQHRMGKRAAHLGRIDVGKGRNLTGLASASLEWPRLWH